MSNIIVLKLNGCYMDTTMIAKMLASVKALKAFTYHLCPQLIPLPRVFVAAGNSWFAHNWEDISRGLRLHRDSLTMLDTTEDVEWIPKASFCQIRGKLDSLEVFTQMRELKVYLNILLDLRNGQDSISRKLPKGALSSFTFELLKPSYNLAPLYRNVLMSLKNGIFTVDKKEVYTGFVRGAALGTLGLSPAYAALEEAGIVTHIK